MHHLMGQRKFFELGNERQGKKEWVQAAFWVALLCAFSAGKIYKEIILFICRPHGSEVM
jgi:hypothetical protein